MRPLPVWKTVLVSAIFAALAALLAWQRAAPEAQASVASAQKVTVAFSRQPQSTLLQVALAKGYFAAEGLAVEPLILSYGKQALEALLEDRADFAAVAETPIMFSVLRGNKPMVIAMIEASSLNDGIVARTTGGLASAADLKGRRVGFTPGTTSDFFLDSLLTANGLTRSQVKAVPLQPDEMEDALVAGRVDAVSTWNYTLARIAKRLGAEAIVFNDREIYTETYNIAVRQRLLDSDPQAAERFLRALIRAETLVAQQPREAQMIMAAATQVDPELIREVWNAFSYNVVLDQTLLLALEDEARWAMASGLSANKTMPDFRAHIQRASLGAVKPDAVRITR